MPGILPRMPLKVRGDQLALSVPKQLVPLINERVQNRLRQLARLIGREPALEQYEEGAAD